MCPKRSIARKGNRSNERAYLFALILPQTNPELSRDASHLDETLSGNSKWCLLLIIGSDIRSILAHSNLVTTFQLVSLPTADFKRWIWSGISGKLLTFGNNCM
jgi:hypothetical protein